MARKLKLEIAPDELPPLPDNDQIGGNEMEGILVRALRVYETPPTRRSAAGQAKPLPRRASPRRSPTSGPRPTPSGWSSWTCSR